MSRRVARIAMMQILFVMNHNNDYSLSNLERVISTPRDEEEAKVILQLLRQHNKSIKRDLIGKKFSQGELSYIRDAMPKLIEELDKIDELISKNLKGWSLDRLAQVDLAILRVAVYEFLYREDIPEAVSINEAVDMAKTYSTEDSSRFINGILGSIIRGRVDTNEGTKSQ